MNKSEKSKSCSKVLQLMDEGKSYQAAIEIVIFEDGVNRNKLENELNEYI